MAETYLEFLLFLKENETLTNKEKNKVKKLIRKFFKKVRDFDNKQIKRDETNNHLIKRFKQGTPWLTIINHINQSPDNQNNNNDNFEMKQNEIIKQSNNELCATINCQTIIKDNESLLLYFPNIFTIQTLQTWFEISLHQIIWQKPSFLPRHTAWFSECSCPYSYGNITVSAQHMPQWLSAIYYEIDKNLKLNNIPLPNCCNANLYEDETDGVNWHSDDEILFNTKDNNIKIISLSIGAQRLFQIKNKQNNKITDLMLHSGDIVVMQGKFQKYYYHRIPKSFNTKCGTRVNFTWRWIKNHHNICLNKK